MNVTLQNAWSFGLPCARLLLLRMQLPQMQDCCFCSGRTFTVHPVPLRRGWNLVIFELQWVDCEGGLCSPFCYRHSTRLKCSLALLDSSTITFGPFGESMLPCSSLVRHRAAWNHQRTPFQQRLGAEMGTVFAAFVADFFSNMARNVVDFQGVLLGGFFVPFLGQACRRVQPEHPFLGPKYGLQVGAMRMDKMLLAHIQSGSPDPLFKEQLSIIWKNFKEKRKYVPLWWLLWSSRQSIFLSEPAWRTKCHEKLFSNNEKTLSWIWSCPNVVTQHEWNGIISSAKCFWIACPEVGSIIYMERPRFLQRHSWRTACTELGVESFSWSGPVFHGKSLASMVGDNNRTRAKAASLGSMIGTLQLSRRNMNASSSICPQDLSPSFFQTRSWSTLVASCSVAKTNMCATGLTCFSVTSCPREW